MGNALRGSKNTCRHTRYLVCVSKAARMVSTTRYGLSRTASWVKTHRLKYKSNRAQLSDRSGRPEMPRVCVCFYVQKSRRHRHHDGKTTPKRPLAFPFLPSSRGIRNEGWKTCSSGLRLPRLGLGREKCVDFLGWTSLLSHVVAQKSEVKSPLQL